MRITMNINPKYCIIFQSYTEVKLRAFMPSKPARTARTAKNKSGRIAWLVKQETRQFVRFYSKNIEFIVQHVLLG